VDQTAHALLETVALAAHQDQESAGLGRESEVGDSVRMQQQQLLADVQNPSDQPGHIQRVVTGARFAQRERTVVQGTGLHGTEEKREGFVERANLVVPPTADPHGGWCGGWELETPGYPINPHRHHCRDSKSERSTRLRNLVELNSVLFASTTVAIPLVG